MFALLSVLASASIAMVSAQDAAVFNTSGLLFDKPFTSSCSINAPRSCSIPDPRDQDPCCYEYPGGLLLQTQFWDTHPSIGPHDSWTIHGLWPDKCDGTFVSKCDSSRDYHNIGDLLDEQGASNTRSFMERYWINNKFQTEEFWEHEWSEHGTCYNTLQPSCLPPHSPRGAEAVAFFQRVVGLFQQLPTYQWLAQAGITPSSHQEYDFDDVISALREASGVTPEVTCKHGAIQEISWYFYLKGSVIDGKFIPIDSPKRSECGRGPVRYLPKSR